MPKSKRFLYDFEVLDVKTKNQPADTLLVKLRRGDEKPIWRRYAREEYARNLRIVKATRKRKHH